MHQLPPSMLPLARRFRGPDEPLTGKGTKAVTPSPSLSMSTLTANAGDTAVAVRENETRKILGIQNQSTTESLRVSSQGPAGGSPAIVLTPGQYWEPYIAPSNQLWIAPAGAVAVSYLLVEG